MKKIIWVVGGVLLVAVVLIKISNSGSTEGGTTEHTDDWERTTTNRTEGGAGEVLASADETVEWTSLSAHDRNGQAEMPAPQLSQPVKALLGLDGKKYNYPSLLAAINELGDEISADDLAALMNMLNFPNDRFPEGMRAIEINAVKNDVLDKLLRQEALPEGLGLQMVEMAGDADSDPVWRDYCIQFMQPFYERASVEAMVPADHADDADNESHQSASSAGQLKAIHDAMFQALDERGTTIAGTSLIGLELLSRTHDEFDREVIVAKASEIAADEMAAAASRMTALRLSAGISNNEHDSEGIERNLISNVEVAETARSLAQTGETVLLRSAAIVTLGEVGTSDDRELLESYMLADNKQIAGAARMALEKMDGR